jgi:hypothetical protein
MNVGRGQDTYMASETAMPLLACVRNGPEFLDNMIIVTRDMFSAGRSQHRIRLNVTCRFLLIS